MNDVNYARALRADIETLLDGIAATLPEEFPHLDRLRVAVGRWGRKKLKEVLLHEAERRYAAERVLKQHGFQRNRAGKWILAERTPHGDATS